MDVFELQKRYGFKHAAQTRGELPVRYEEKGEIHEIPLKKVNAKDTLGAGDIFHGAFCYYKYVEKHNFKKSLELSADFASESVEVNGVESGIKYAKLKKQ